MVASAGLASTFSKSALWEHFELRDDWTIWDLGSIALEE
jgi:hypothetical protein